MKSSARLAVVLAVTATLGYNAAGSASASSPYTVNSCENGCLLANVPAIR